MSFPTHVSWTVLATALLVAGLLVGAVPTSGAPLPQDPETQDKALKEAVREKEAQEQENRELQKGKAGKETDAPTARFEGNRALSADRLRRAIVEELEEYAKDPRDAYLDDAAYEIRAFYRSQGYPQVEVHYEAASGAGPLFKVVEGVKVTVAAVNFTGNQAFSGQQLRAFFESSRDGLLNKGEGPFSKSTIENEARQVQSFYRSVGYLEAVVEDLVHTESGDGKHVTITVPINEGPLFTLHQIELVGVELLNPATEESLRNEFVGRPFHPRIPFQIRGRLQGSFGNRGYPDADIAPQTTMDEQSGEVSLIFTCSPGSLVTISEIVIQGAERTRENFILSRVALEPGRVYDERLQRETFRRLYRSGLFRSVRINLGEATDGGRPLIVVVEESSSQEVFVEPGFGSYEGLRLRLGFKERNLFGAGIRLRGDAVIAQRSYNGSVTYSDPWTSIDSLTTEVSLSTNQRELDGFTTNKTGIGTALRQDWSDKVTSSLGYQFRRSENRDLTTGEPIVAISQEDVDISSISLINRYDDRNNIFIPTKGWRAELDLEYGTDALGSELDFFRMQTTAAFYESLTGSTTLALAFRAGAIFPLGSETEIPLQERYVSGGENSVRAFREGRLLPTTQEGVKLADEEGNSQGGEAFATFTAELRRRIYGNLQGAIFLDTGFLTAEAEDIFDPFEIRTGAGIGLRYLLPIGPLRLDGAWNLGAQEGEETFILHFSVGMAI